MKQRGNTKGKTGDYGDDAILVFGDDRFSGRLK